MVAMWRPSWQKATERTHRSLAPPAKMGEGGGKRCLWEETKKGGGESGTESGVGQQSQVSSAICPKSTLSTLERTRTKRLFHPSPLTSVALPWCRVFLVNTNREVKHGKSALGGASLTPAPAARCPCEGPTGWRGCRKTRWPAGRRRARTRMTPHHCGGPPACGWECTCPCSTGTPARAKQRGYSSTAPQPHTATHTNWKRLSQTQFNGVPKVCSVSTAECLQTITKNTKTKPTK